MCEPRHTVYHHQAVGTPDFSLEGVHLRMALRIEDPGLSRVEQSTTPDMPQLELCNGTARV